LLAIANPSATAAAKSLKFAQPFVANGKLQSTAAIVKTVTNASGRI
jgi:hypothetical protein